MPEINRIGRNIKVTTCEGMYYDKNNNKSKFSVRVFGIYDIDKLTRKVARILKTNRILIDPDSIKTEEYWASMPLDKFVQHADKLPHKKERI